LATAHNGVVAQHNGGCFGQCTVAGDNGAVEWFLMQILQKNWTEPNFGSTTSH
jgi:hypothetical protein